MLLDIAFGLYAGKYFGYKFLGVVLTLLPDVDFITDYLYNKKRTRILKLFSHRGLLHTPFLYICIAVVLFLLNFDIKIIFLFLTCSLFHLTHDLFVLGRGIMVLYPFSKNRLKLFPDDGKTGYLKKKYLWWNEDTEPKFSKTENSLDSNSWIKDWYFRPNLFLFIETSFAILFIILIFST